MAEGKIRIPALEGTPEQIADFKRAARMDWSSPPPGAVKNLIDLDYEAAAARYAKEAATLKDAALLSLTTGDLFNELVRRLNYDGNDTSSITLGEIQRAVVGAKL